MSNWDPITLDELVSNEIAPSQAKLIDEQWRFWKLIQIAPEKWEEKTMGADGNGFWVVAICGKHIIWYNDIEDGFNISSYDSYGEIDGYFCNQDELSESVQRLFRLVIRGGELTGQMGPPESF